MSEGKPCSVRPNSEDVFVNSRGLFLDRGEIELGEECPQVLLSRECCLLDRLIRSFRVNGCFVGRSN
jgi:hypothetical protein